MPGLPVDQQQDSELPIHSFKEKILGMLNVNSTLILQGYVGCGKTTQIPQYILDDSNEKNQVCNIAVTVPTQLAAINIARRVCVKRGTACRYEIGLGKKMASDASLTYMTSDVLLQKIVAAKSLDQFTHIIIDDIHERSRDVDFLLLLIKRFLFSNSSNTKVIFMSGVNDLDAKLFSHYFGSQESNYFLSAPVVYVKKDTSYTRSILYIEEVCKVIEKTIDVPIEFDNPQISEQLWKIFVCLVHNFDKIDERDPISNEPIIGTVLVFLPGIEEIENAQIRLFKYIQKKKKHSDNKKKRISYRTSEKQKVSTRIQWEVKSIHSYNQTQVLKPTRIGYRKVILCTSVAENSITVPDAQYVIDFCQTTAMRVDLSYNHYSLKTEWASQVSCDQRAGRVGRTKNGKVYRLVPSVFYNEEIPKRTLPDILQVPLDKVTLRSKMLGINESPQEILATAIYTPLCNIEYTYHSLQEIGGLLPTCRGLMTVSDGDLTFLGTVMASLPIDVRLSKFIVLGHLFGYLEEAIIIAAGCSIPNILPSQKKQSLCPDGSSSDFLELLRLFEVCRRDKAKLRNRTKKSANKLSEWNALAGDIKTRLAHLNIKATTGQDRILLSDDEKALVLNVITAGAFYPNYFINVNENHQDGKLKVELQGCITSSANKIVEVESTSVNADLLHTEPENVNTRLLVAAYICQSYYGLRWTLRQTSLLPNIPGLPMLLSLLFCSKMRVRLTEDGTRVSSILCGAGYNKYTRRPYFQLHDLTLTLDTELTRDDVNKINQIRMYMNQGIRLMSEGVRGKCRNEDMIETQNSLRKELKELIFLPRKHVDKATDKVSIDWRENNADIVLQPDLWGEEDDIWPMLPFVELKNKPSG